MLSFCLIFCQFQLGFAYKKSVKYFLPSFLRIFYLCWSWHSVRTCAYQGGKKCSFFGKFGLLGFLGTPVLRVALLPYYRRTTISTGKKFIAYPVSLSTTQKFLSSSINSSVMLYILIKSNINSELPLALNVPSVMYIMKHHCIFLMNVFMHKCMDPT